MVNRTIMPFGGATTIADMYFKVDVASGGMLSLTVHVILFFIILAAFSKKYGSFERGLSSAGFVTSIVGALLTVFGILAWNWIWMSLIFFIIGFMSKNLE